MVKRVISWPLISSSAFELLGGPIPCSVVFAVMCLTRLFGDMSPVPSFGGVTEGLVCVDAEAVIFWWGLFWSASSFGCKYCRSKYCIHCRTIFSSLECSSVWPRSALEGAWLPPQTGHPAQLSALLALLELLLMPLLVLQVRALLFGRGALLVERRVGGVLRALQFSCVGVEASCPFPCIDYTGILGLSSCNINR